MHLEPVAQEPLLVSACLLGLRTRWDGAERRSRAAVEAVRSAHVIPVCPEQLGGLSTPREPAEIEGADGRAVLAGEVRVVSRDRRDVTEKYLRGARETLGLARLFGATRAILKEGSPACGVCRIQRAGRDVKGMGVTAALLAQEGLKLEGID